MAPNDNDRYRGLSEEGGRIQEAMNAAARDAMLEHKRAGVPGVGMRDGRIVWLYAEETEKEEEQTGRSR